MFYFHSFFKLMDLCAGTSFSMCSHDPIFGTNKNRIFRNGSCERALRIGDFYDLPTSGILTTSVNTPSQTSQTVGDFYDVIGRIGSISTLKLHPRRSPTSAILTMDMKFACLGRSPTIGDFYNECEHDICLSATSGMLDFVLTCYQSLIFSEL